MNCAMPIVVVGTLLSACSSLKTREYLQVKGLVVAAAEAGPKVSSQAPTVTAVSSMHAEDGGNVEPSSRPEGDADVPPLSSVEPSVSATDTASLDAAQVSGDCEVPHAASERRGVACVVVECHPGFLDADQMPDNGCEAPDLPEQQPLIWLSADYGLTFGRDGHAQQWASRTNGYVATSGDAPGPTLSDDASEPPMLYFGGSDSMVLPPVPPITELTFTAVVDVLPTSFCSSFLHLSNRDPNDVERTSDELEFGRHQGKLYFESLGAGLYAGQESLPPYTRHVAAIRILGTEATASLFSDGHLWVENGLGANAPTAVVRNSNFIGDNHWRQNNCQPYQGKIGEILFYDSGLSDASLNQVVVYLAEKWGVPLSSP